MQKEGLRMRLRSRSISTERLFADYKQAASLLKDDLVWSGDFDSIRDSLRELIQKHAKSGNYPAELTEIVQTLISEENDLSV